MLRRQTADVLAHKCAPIGIRRLNAEAEEREPGEQENDEDEAKPQIREHRPDDVG